ncbi:MAG: heme A synthase [Acidimicrobiia bacterium]|nr:COX15/CtaA family protein [Acidimicrobiia bacterium]MBT8192168.1 COX15/CtaA family protein [Acidimicrobiia bacterium]MBT8247558.1 COX15/CtaA family protein [Acidimicrobiia bacterium]NNF88758.1 heme A synthase [Acidimicrobiia bacterium]NNJ47955.1 heme A synthase [Acidimicrobiia bacterium]
MNRFAKVAWLTTGVTVFVVLWGAIVRATGSGAGCGNNWPTCNGEVLPLSGSAETAIEFVHRITSAGLGLLILYLLVLAIRKYPTGHRVQRAAIATFALVIVESLVGAGLVLFEQTGEFEGVSRAYWQSGHFVNTLLLLAAATLTAWWASTSPPDHDETATPRERRLIGAVGVGMLILGVSGAIAALGDTLFPVDSFVEGLERELSATGHIFERLRIFHPAIAIGVGLLAVWVVNELAESRQGRVGRVARFVSLLVLVQLALGTVNALLAAPIWIQVIHLLLADLVWMGLVVLAADVLATRRVGATT